METLYYKAIGADGTPFYGRLSAEGIPAAVQSLQDRGLVATYVGSARPRRLFWLLPSALRNTKHVLRFTEETATLLSAGIPLEQALEICSEARVHKGISAVFQRVLQSLRSGESFADSLAQHPDCFSRLYINMVRAGEAGGCLPAVMERLASFQRTRNELRESILSALIYPVLLLLVGSVSILLLLYYVIPNFAASFQTNAWEIPASMQILLSTSTAVRNWWLPVSILLFFVAGAMLAWIQTPSGRTRVDTWLLRLPFLGQLLLASETERFSRAMGTLLAGTVPLVEALGIARGILSNRALDALLEPVIQGVKRGEGLAVPVMRSGVLPQLVGRLLTVGERTGKLDTMFDRLAEIHARQTRESIKRFTALFEPMVVLFLGSIIGVMIFSIMLALTSIYQVGF